jgi:hypothetical protein
MSYKSENWQQKLAEVRGHIPRKEGSLEKTADEIINEEIESELRLLETTEEVVEEGLILEASAGGMIDQLFNLKGDKDAGYGVAKMLNMTGVKVVQAMQKQNPDGFMKTVKALGKDSKIKLATNNALMKMFKDAGVKPLKDEVKEEKLSVEKSIEKLTEKNMLGRLAKSMELNEDNKEKLFDYFDKGELQQ